MTKQHYKILHRQVNMIRRHDYIYHTRLTLKDSIWTRKYYVLTIQHGH